MGLQGNWNLGLDIGSNSIGWILVREQPVPGERNLIGGVRVFPAGTTKEQSGETSSCVGRRTARGMRRQIDRRSRRKRRLLHVLRNAEVLTAADAEFQALLKLDPYELRSRALDEPLALNEVSRVLIHLNQRRGFKSNRRAARDKDSGTVAEGISQTAAAMAATESRTLGEYLHKYVPAGAQRRRGRYVARTMIREEFDTIWRVQSAYHPDKLNDELYHELTQSVIFFQRAFDQVTEDMVGRCSLEPELARARLGHRLAHKYRILTEIDNIRISPAGYRNTLPDGRLNPEQKAVLLDALQRKPKLTREQTQKLLKFESLCDINLMKAGRTYLGGNTSEQTLEKAFGPAWKKLTEEQKNSICNEVLELEDEPLISKASNEWGLTPEQIDVLLRNPLKPEKYGNMSLRAIQKLVPLLENGLSLAQAREKAYPYAESAAANREPYPLLPFPPGTMFNAAGLENALAKRLIYEGSCQPITNPVVRKALFEVRKLVNAIIREYGLPYRIRVELARDTKGSIEDRNERSKENARNRKERERIREHIREIFQSLNLHQEPTGGDIMKYRLWEECNRQSPYSGEPITLEQLFTGEVEVEHIIPFGRCLDDGFANKTLCFRNENQDKGMQTPHEWLSHNAQKYHEVLERVRRYHGEYASRKRQRFEQKEVKVLDEWIARQLTDTQYICRQVTSYLACLYPPVRGNEVRVQVGRGQTTATLRHLWGLNSILWEINGDSYGEQTEDKNRGDHRHHAIDAAIVALTSPSILRTFSRRWELKDRKVGFPLPWDGFRDELKEVVRGIVVSHASTRKVRGQLHKETLYGTTAQPSTYAVRKPLNSLTRNQLGDIIDPGVRRIVLLYLSEQGVDMATASDKDIQKALGTSSIRLPNCPAPIRRVRVKAAENKVIQLPRSNGHPAIVTTGGNHHVSIFEWEENGKVVREPIGVSLYEAAQRVRQGRLVFQKAHPRRTDAEFVMSLCKNDVVELRYRGGEPELCRLQKQTVYEKPTRNSCILDFRLLTGSDIKDKKTLRQVSGLAPDSFEARKITVDILGRIYPCNE